MVKKTPKAESDDKLEEKPKVGVVIKSIKDACCSICDRASHFIALFVLAGRVRHDGQRAGL